jgi:hypothetical protein
MKKWPWHRILTILSLLLIVVGASPLVSLLWFRSAHNFQPLSMPVPLKQGEYTSTVFKTDLDEPYMVQVEFANSSRTGLNRDAVLDMDWKIVDANGMLVRQGAQNTRLSWANAVNLDEYHPKRGVAQRIIVNLHRDIVEPVDSHVTLEVNSTEDPESMVIEYELSRLWAIIVAGPGATLFFILLIRRPAAPETSSKTPQTPSASPPESSRWQ